MCFPFDLIAQVGPKLDQAFLMFPGAHSLAPYMVEQHSTRGAWPIGRPPCSSMALLMRSPRCWGHRLSASQHWREACSKVCIVLFTDLHPYSQPFCISDLVPGLGGFRAVFELVKARKEGHREIMRNHGRVLQSLHSGPISSGSAFLFG